METEKRTGGRCVFQADGFLCSELKILPGVFETDPFDDGSEGFFIVGVFAVFNPASDHCD